MIVGSSLRVPWLWGRGTKHSTLYITQAKIVKDVVHAAEFIDGTDLWHKKLCHMSEKGKSVLV